VLFGNAPRAGDDLVSCPSIHSCAVQFSFR
jgi:hypothetical protein